MIKFSYAISDFHTLRREGYLYLDRTHAITDLEEAAKQLKTNPRELATRLLDALDLSDVADCVPTCTNWRATS